MQREVALHDLRGFAGAARTLAPRTSFAMVLTSALAMGGCADLEGEYPEDSELLADGDDESRSVQESEQGLFRTGALAPSRSIPVCFMPRAYSFPQHPNWSQLDTFRERVRTSMDETLGRYTDLRFSGWGPCPAFGPAPAGAGTIAIDLTSDPYSFNLVGFRSNGPTTIVYGYNAVGDALYGWSAAILREVMKGLGFDAESSRPDYSSSTACPDPYRIGKSGDTLQTPYDDQSALACGIKLSPWDVVGLQQVYGTKAASSIVGVDNKCVALLSVPPAPLKAGECRNTSDEQWRLRDSLSLRHPFYNAGTMDVVNMSTADGATVQAWTFHGGVNQQWSWNGVKIRGLGELCLGSSSLTAGSSLSLQSCTSSYARSWDIVRPSVQASYATSIRATGTNLCIDFAPTGNAVTLQPCKYAAGDYAQGLYLRDGQIGPPPLSTYRCLDVNNDNASAGATIQGNTCTTSSEPNKLARLAQRFHFRGPIQSGVAANKCLDFDVSPGRVVNGTKTQIWTCNGWANQEFDYYF